LKLLNEVIQHYGRFVAKRPRERAGSWRDIEPGTPQLHCILRLNHDNFLELESLFPGPDAGDAQTGAPRAGRFKLIALLPSEKKAQGEG